MKRHIILFLSSLILGSTIAAQSLANGFDQACSQIQIVDAESESGKEIGTAVESYSKVITGLKVRIIISEPLRC